MNQPKIEERPQWFTNQLQAQQDAIITRITQLLDAETTLEERAQSIASQFSLPIEKAREISSIVSSQLFSLRQQSSTTAGGIKFKFKVPTDAAQKENRKKDEPLGEVLKADQFATYDDKMLTAEGGPFYAYSQCQKVSDSSALFGRLRSNNECYPIWVNPDLTIQLEYWEHPLPPSSSIGEGGAVSGGGGGGVASIPTSPQVVSEELLSIAEPKSRPDLIHCYALSTESLHGAAYGHNLTAKHIIGILEKYSKMLPLPESVIAFVEACSERFCRAKLLLVASKHFVVSTVPVLKHLLKNPTIRNCRNEDAFALRGEFESMETIEEDPRLLNNGNTLNPLLGDKSNPAGNVLVGSTSTLSSIAPSSPIMRIEEKDKHAEESELKNGSFHLDRKSEEFRDGNEDEKGNDMEDDEVTSSYTSWMEKSHFYHAQENDFDESLHPLKFKMIRDIVSDMHGKRKNKSILPLLHDLDAQTCTNLLRFLAQEMRYLKATKSDKTESDSKKLQECGSANLLINQRMKNEVMSHLNQPFQATTEIISTDPNAMVDDEEKHERIYSNTFSACEGVGVSGDNDTIISLKNSSAWYCDNVDISPDALLKAVSMFGISASQVEKVLHWLVVTLQRYLKNQGKTSDQSVQKVEVGVKEEGKRVIKLKLNKKKQANNRVGATLMEVKKEETLAEDSGEEEEEVQSKSSKRTKLSHRFQIQEGRGLVESVREQAWLEGFPLLEEYDFNRDSRNKVIYAPSRTAEAPPKPYALKPDKKLRDYQEKALYSMFGAHNKARSGIVVLPCGAGKTLVGITAAQRIGRSTIVLCNNNAAAEQWRRAFLEFTDIPEKKLLMFHAKSKPGNLPDPCILITTYSILMDRKTTGGDTLGESARATKEVLKAICGTAEAPREWALMVLDEVHMSPATMFRTVMDKCKTQCKLGLTATLVREDEKIGELSYLIGPKLHEANWTELAAQNHLATVKCFEVWCDMDGNHMREVLARAGQPHAWENGGQKLISIMNPNKYRAAEYLLRKHQAAGDKVLLFSDSIYSLTEYCEKLDIPKLHGDTKHEEREALLGCFRGQAEYVFRNFVRIIRKRRGLGKHKWENVVNGVDEADDINKKLLKEFKSLSPKQQQAYQFPALGLSSVGDVAIDLPDANVILQVSGQGGGRRQEAQRMGRILRKKSNGLDNNAKFYTLLSRDTKEMVTGAKRQEYLIDQGYQYKVILASDLIGDWESKTLPVNTIAESNVLKGVLEAIDKGEANNEGGTKGRGGRGGKSKQTTRKAPSSNLQNKYSQPGREALFS